MFRWGYMVCMAMLLSLTMAVGIHARELAGTSDIECSGYVHSEGDADQSRGDADKAIPHHHNNCHGGSALSPRRETKINISPFIALSGFFDSAVALGCWISGPDLRPPIA